MIITSFFLQKTIFFFFLSLFVIDGSEVLSFKYPSAAPQRTAYSEVTVSDIKSQGQPACQEEQKISREESINVIYECDV
jgi:hypothetical protein